MVTGVADRMSKHRYQLGMVGAERQRGGRASPGPRAEAPKPKASELRQQMSASNARTPQLWRILQSAI